jgi:hypothetical protein
VYFDISTVSITFILQHPLLPPQDLVIPSSHSYTMRRSKFKFAFYISTKESRLPAVSFPWLSFNSSGPDTSMQAFITCLLLKRRHRTDSLFSIHWTDKLSSCGVLMATGSPYGSTGSTRWPRDHRHRGKAMFVRRKQCPFVSVLH